MMNSYEEYKVGVKEGSSGVWKVEQFVVSEEDAGFHNLRCAFSAGGMGRQIDEGKYTKLTRSGKIIMSDTPAEIRDHLGFIRKAKGKVLINGLGLGMVANAVARKEEVEAVYVVEKSRDVIELVKDSLHPKVVFIHADAHEFNPVKAKILDKGEKFDSVWHDIFDDICTDNWEDMKKLHRRYGKWADFQDSWSRRQVEYRAKQEKREERRWGKRW